jgi:hypothetical protein
MDILNNGWVQLLLGLIAVALIVWWFKYRPQSY